MDLARLIEELSRREGARILASLVSWTGDLDLAEEALQDAYSAALGCWGDQGVPRAPGAWVLTTARRRVLDQVRRRRGVELDPREASELAEVESVGPEIDEVPDDSLRLLFTACHPALSPKVRCCAALRWVGGLSTAEIARAFLEPEATTSQRLVRAKHKIRETLIPFVVPEPARMGERLDTVLSVLYLVFNEGYASTSAAELVRTDLAAEAIRLGQLLVGWLPEEPEALGLLALMLATHARRDARTDSGGLLVPLEAQDRRLWRADEIAAAAKHLDRALAQGRRGSYQIQAAIACLHGSAESPSETDWTQIALLYRALMELDGSPVVELNAAVAHGMAHGIEPALEWIDRLAGSRCLEGYHLLPAAQADLLRRLGRKAEARVAYGRALALAQNPSERRYLTGRMEAC